MKALLALFFLPLTLGATTLGGSSPNIVDLANKLNLTKFIEALDETKISHFLNHSHQGLFTVFAPSDAAFAREKKYPQEATLHDKVLLHIGQGVMTKFGFSNEMVLKTIQSKRTVRINIYDNGKMTANGRVISSFDHRARNGVIHILDDVMSSVYKRAGSVVSELDECCAEQSIMLGLVKECDLWEMLDETGPYTLLAPTNAAFNKLHPDFILHLKKNTTALRNFMLGHVIPLTHYSAGLEEGQKLKTALGNKIPVHFDDNGKKLFLGKANVQLADITAVNGCVHVIDDVLFPHHDESNGTTKRKPLTKKRNNGSNDIYALLKYIGF